MALYERTGSMLERAVEHGRRWASEPALEHGRVDAAKVGRVAHVAHVRRGKVGQRSVESALYAAADEKERRRLAVIGSAASVLLDAPPELAEGERQDAAIVAVRGQILIEGGDRVGELQSAADSASSFG